MTAARNTFSVVSVTAAHPQKPMPPASFSEINRNHVRNFLEMIKFEHTLFALPFAYAGALLGGQGRLSLTKLLLITIAMVTARTAGMSLNRLIDQDLDAANPRTAHRALPAGLLPAKAVWLAVGVSLLVFELSAVLLNKLALFLSPVALVLLFGYSYLKRTTWLCHLGLGLVLGCAPIGGFVAVTGRLGLVPLSLGTAMLFWLAGFDTLYGCLDVAFDRKAGLHSIPQKFGVQKALWLSSFFHLITFAFLGLTGILAHLGWPYDAGLILVGGILIYEHFIITPQDLSRINQAFFQANAAVSLITFLSVAASYWIPG